MKTYKNRYGDVFTFTKDENHDILWEGNFEYCRVGYPNDYTLAYKTYLDDHADSNISLEEFKVLVHEYKDDDYTSLAKLYSPLVKSLDNEIDMADPSGGPYISRGMALDSFGFKGYVVKDFKKIDTGYKIITDKDESNT